MPEGHPLASYSLISRFGDRGPSVGGSGNKQRPGLERCPGTRWRCRQKLPSSTSSCRRKLAAHSTLQKKISVSEGSLDAKEITKASARTTTFIFYKQEMTLFG